MAKLISLRNEFISKIKSFGITPSLKAPEIVLDNPRSFGNYDRENNVLHMSDWKTLPPQLQAIFISRAKQIGNGVTGESFFEESIHKWVFIHELSHWWRACQHQTALPYAEEMAANRIATAYWREQDPAFMDFMLERFKNNINTIPTPVPSGQSKEDFLNKNYDKLPGGPAYIWYQANMIIDAYNEKPTLNLKLAIERSGN
jgi:hypothetical protein